MKSTIEIAKECGMVKIHSTIVTNDETLEDFRKACEAEFISRCILVQAVAVKVSAVGSTHMTPAGNYYTLPKETK